VTNRPVKETELASTVADWLAAQHWDVFPEVRPGLAWPRADIVARQAGRIWVVECKGTLSLRLLQQAEPWRPWAHWVSVAVPHQRRGRSGSRPIALQILAWLGIGLIEVRDDRAGQEMPPRLNRMLAGRLLLDALNEGHQRMGVAGSASQFWSPYRQTCQGLLAYVRQHPRCTIRDAVAGIEHHYGRDTTARSCLLHWADSGAIPGVRVEREGGRLYLVTREGGGQP
jgi:hypothetical protein